MISTYKRRFFENMNSATTVQNTLTLDDVFIEVHN